MRAREAGVRASRPRPRRRTDHGRPALAALAAAIALTASCRSAPAARLGPTVQAPSPTPTAAGSPRPEPAAIPPPIFRIGIVTEAARASLAADSGVVVRELAGGAEAAPRIVQRATFVGTGASGGSRIRLLETKEELGSVVVFPANPEEVLSVDGAEYRGRLEVRPDVRGTVLVVNVVNLEDYLRGVLPNELSPLQFPELEAQKAQAVAARTYALKHRGQYQAKGYDLCATPACQVYRGRSTEHSASDQAVEETRGLIASYQGEPISALYTSTCGGHTEDGANVFAESESGPYLRGVACVPERTAWAGIRTTASTAALGETEGLNRDAALLVALGVLEPRMYKASVLGGAASESELHDLVQRLVGALHRRGCESRVGPPLARRATFFHYLVGRLCWTERAERMLAPGDPGFLLQFEDRGDLVGDGERKAAALLVQEGILSPLPGNTLGVNAAVRRAQAVTLLARAAVRAGPPTLIEAQFRSASAGELTVKRSGALESYPLDPAARFFRLLDGMAEPVSELSLVAGTKVSFVTTDGRVTFLEAEQSRLGAAADHTSRYYRWEVRLTADDVARAAARYGGVGVVKDVIPRRRGVSGRVVELAIVGREGEVVLKGLKIRGALGLRENLFVIDRERGADGAVERFIFTGKGWGHGVGLCQVGAFGMAQAGATFTEILTHYYSGITIQKAY